MKIAVGTTSKHKLEFLSEVLDNLGIKAEIVPVEVESKVSNQPLSESETETGSLNRAENALKKVGSADFGLGIEVGYHKNKQGGLDMFCCASIVGSDGYNTSCVSSKLPLPKFHQEIIAQKQNLGDFVREFKKDDKEKHTNVIRDMIIFRKELIMEATRNVLLNYLLKNEY